MRKISARRQALRTGHNVPCALGLQNRHNKKLRRYFIMEKQYQVVNGMAFDTRTPHKVCEVLSSLANHQPRERVRLWVGDTETGKPWAEEYDVMGYIGRRTGAYKIPLMVNNARSIGGGAILDHCVLKITRGGVTLYQADNFKMYDVRANGKQVFIDGVLHANCKDEKQAQRLAGFMAGTRNAK
jgi:hypothetical protein